MSEVQPTGNPDIDGILGGFRWDQAQITFSFPTGASDYGYQSVNDFHSLNTAQQAAAQRAFAQVSSFANLTFVQTTDANPVLQLAVASSYVREEGGELHTVDTAEATGPFSAGARFTGDLWFNPDDFNQPVPGNYADSSFMHEIGHSLGLKHGQDAKTIHDDTFPELPADHNSKEYSVMTYHTYVGDTELGDTSLDHSTTYMQDDIAALQFLYGANYNFRSGDTVYKWSATTGELSVDGVGQGAPESNFIFMTVWDGGGRDTYDFSSYSTGLTVDLSPGAWTITTEDQLARLGEGHLARGSIANALLFEGNTASLIENAVGGSGSDLIRGNAAANSLFGGRGADTIEGGDGADTLNGGEGRDVLKGGLGDDHYVLADVIPRLPTGSPPASDTVVELAGEGYDTIYVGRAGTTSVRTGYTLDANIEHGVITGEGAFDLTGNGGDNRLDGNVAANRLTGGAGADTLDGDRGHDVLAGGLGNDHYILGDVVAPENARTTGSTAGMAVYDSVVEAAGAGIDTVFVGYAVDGGFVRSSYTLGDNIERGVVTGSDAFNLTGNALDNALDGNAAANRLVGGGGRDTLDGGDGGDTLEGGAGNDIYRLEDIANAPIFAKGSPGTITAAADLVVEAAGAGTDTVMVGRMSAGGLTLSSYTLTANVENGIVTGAGDFSLTGNGLANALTGNAAANTLAGGLGNDVLTGGWGQDSFVFSTALSAASNVDRITDFNVADDTIRLDHTVFSGLSVGTLSAESFHLGAAADADDRVLYDPASGRLAYDKDGSGAGAAVQFATLSAGLALTHQDFIVV